MTKWRGHSLAIATSVFHILAGFASSMPFLKDYLELVKLVIISVAALGMISVFILYYKTTRTVKSRVSSLNNPFMKSTMIHSKTIANAAVSSSICTAVLLVPYIIGVIIVNIRNNYQVYQATELAIFKWFTYLGSHANGVCSCIIFIVQNEPVKRVIKSMIVYGQSQ